VHDTNITARLVSVQSARRRYTISSLYRLHRRDTTVTDDAAVAVKRRHPLYYLLVVVVAVLAAMLIKLVITNPRFQWRVVAHYIVSSAVLQGLRLTVILAIVIFAVATVLGIFIALARLSQFRLIRDLAIGYLWFFRAVPLLVQILFWFNLGYFIPTLSVGIPFGPSIAHWQTNSLISALTAAIIAIALHDAATIAEIVRGGILSVGQGQIDAAKALGLRPAQIARKITLPQAARIVTPPLGNQLIATVKATSLVSVVSLADVLFVVESIYAINLEIVPLLLVASIWYIVVVAFLTVLQALLERKLSNAYKATGDSRKAGESAVLASKIATGEL
jgi:polar amino acid transport system permease protein